MNPLKVTQAGSLLIYSSKGQSVIGQIRLGCYLTTVGQQEISLKYCSNSKRARMRNTY